MKPYLQHHDVKRGKREKGAALLQDKKPYVQRKDGLTLEEKV